MESINDNNPNIGLFYAAQSGNQKLIDYYISKGADNWLWGFWGAKFYQNQEIVKFFEVKMANDKRYSWPCGRPIDFILQPSYYPLGVWLRP
jgi:hypothetical protein